MRKSFVRDAVARPTVAAAAVAIGLVGGGSAQAASITETFTLDTLTGYASETGSAFSAFDPALGTLNSVTYDVTATASFTGGEPTGLNLATYVLTFAGRDSTNTAVLTTQSMTAASLGNGVAQASLTATDSSVATYLVPSAVTPNLMIEGGALASLSSTFPTESVTYNYTPFSPAPVPESSSITLLAIGFAGLTWSLRHRPLSAAGALLKAEG